MNRREISVSLTLTICHLIVELIQLKNIPKFISTSTSHIENRNSTMNIVFDIDRGKNGCLEEKISISNICDELRIFNEIRNVLDVEMIFSLFQFLSKKNDFFLKSKLRL